MSLSVFDIGSPELLLIAVVALLVLGPERLPDAMRNTARTWYRLRKTLDKNIAQIQDEIGFDQIRQQLDEEGAIGEIKAMQIDLNELTGGGGLTELEKPVDSSNPAHWPGMPPS